MGWKVILAAPDAPENVRRGFTATFRGSSAPGDLLKVIPGAKSNSGAPGGSHDNLNIEMRLICM